MALREQISQYISKSIEVSYNPETEITITNGASEALYCAINAFVNPGDNVLVFEPAFDLYYQAIAGAGGNAIPIRLYAPDTPLGRANNGNWTIDWHEFDAAAASGFSLMIFNSPHNPTGKVFNEEEMDRIASKALKHQAIILSDEVYENLVYDEAPYFSLAEIPKIQHLVVRISSAAKTFGFTGLKVGWACAKPHLTNAIRTVHQATVFCVSPFTQLGIANAISDESWLYAYLKSQKEEYARKRRTLTEILKSAGYFVGPCQGTFFLMANYENLEPEMQDFEYAQHLVKTKGIATIPISPFYLKAPVVLPWVRFAFCKKEETLEAVSKKLAAVSY